MVAVERAGKARSNARDCDVGGFRLTSGSCDVSGDRVVDLVRNGDEGGTVDWFC